MTGQSIGILVKNRVADFALIPELMRAVRDSMGNAIAVTGPPIWAARADRAANPTAVALPRFPKNGSAAALADSAKQARRLPRRPRA